VADEDDDFECFGFAKMNAQGQLQIPKDVREALGWEGGTPLMVFAKASERCAMITTKPVDAELLSLARTAGSASAKKK
jgi:AbrB family looped-hinge helix DNA binding protein